LVLTVLGPNAAGQMASYVRRNADHFRASMPTPPSGYETVSYWRERLRAQREAYRSGTAAHFAMLDKQRRGGPIVGDLSFTGIVHGASKMCYLGYRLDRDAVGNGWMTEAVRAGVAHMFGAFEMHRISANYEPTNASSGRVLRRVGFTIEGYARDYLYLNGAWRDHILTSLLREDA
jgi:ribosomal-protein-alanine N-acetyltransferase